MIGTEEQEEIVEAILRSQRELVNEVEAGNKLDKYEIIRVHNPKAEELRRSESKTTDVFLAACEFYLDFCIWKKDKGIHQGMWVSEEMTGAICLCGVSDTRENLIKDLIELGKEHYKNQWRYKCIKCDIDYLAWKISCKWDLTELETKNYKKYKKEIDKYEFLNFDFSYTDIFIWKKEKGVYKDKWVGHFTKGRGISWVADTRESLIESLTEITREYQDDYNKQCNGEDFDRKWRAVAHFKFTDLIPEEIRKKNEY